MITVSFPTASRLKELGMPQTCFFEFDRNDSTMVVRVTACRHDGLCDAPTAEELLRWLPRSVQREGNELSIARTKKGTNWVACVNEWAGFAPTATEALGLLLIKVVEKGEVKFEGKE